MLLTILQIVEKHQKKLIFGGGILVGLIIGLIFAWGIWPVQWHDAAPGHLHPAYQQYYITSVAKDYLASHDLETAKHELGLDLKPKENPWVEKPETLQKAFSTAAQDPINGPAVGMLAQALGIELTQPQPEPPSGPSLMTALGFLLILFALVAAVFYLVNRLRSKGEKTTGIEGAGTATAYGEVIEEAPADLTAEESGTPLGSYATSYTFGDDFFDPSFSIEKGSDFLGECGIGISETVGAGSPKKVTALEAWLFDKSDIRTVTTVLASDYAFDDEALSAKLAAKGDIKRIKPGMEFELETTALKVFVRVKDVEYADEPDYPPNSIFKKVSVELHTLEKAVPSAPEA